MTARTAAERDRARRARLKAEGKTARIVWVYPEAVESLREWVRKANARVAKARKSSNSVGGLDNSSRGIE